MQGWRRWRHGPSRDSRDNARRNDASSSHARDGAEFLNALVFVGFLVETTGMITVDDYRLG